MEVILHYLIIITIHDSLDFRKMWTKSFPTIDSNPNSIIPMSFYAFTPYAGHWIPGILGYCSDDYCHNNQQWQLGNYLRHQFTQTHDDKCTSFISPNQRAHYNSGVEVEKERIDAKWNLKGLNDQDKTETELKIQTRPFGDDDIPDLVFFILLQLAIGFVPFLTLKAITAVLTYISENQDSCYYYE